MSQIAIIGGGPAGSLAGVLLARRGLPVVLVEQHRFPRHKVCGECLSALVIDILAQADLLDEIHRAGPATISEFALHDSEGRCVTLALPRPMLGLSRFALDRILLDHARAAGADVLQPARCERIHAADGTIEIRDLKCNRTYVFTPAMAILADGRSSLFGAPQPSGDFGIKAHFAAINLSQRAVHLFSLKGHYGGLAPVENGWWNLAISVPARRIRECPNLDELLGRIMAETPAFARAMCHARRATPILCCPLPRFGLRRDWPEHVIPLGNAACAIEPIGGEGMGLALASAAVAAPMIADAFAQGRAVPAAQIRRKFRRLWFTRRPACRLAAMVFSRPTLGMAGMRLLDSVASFRELLLHLMGKAAGVHSTLAPPHGSTLGEGS